MNIRNKVLMYLTILLSIIVLLTTVVGANSDNSLDSIKGKGSSVIGNAYTLSYNDLVANHSLNCIQRGKNLGSQGRLFTLTDYIEIDGTEARVYRQSGSEYSVVTDELNAQVAYILNKKEGYGTAQNPTEAQKALWHITNAWTTTVFGNSTYSYSGNDKIESNEVNTEAENYAKAVGNKKSTDSNYSNSSNQPKLSVVDKTDKNNVAVMDAGDYYRVGPFRWDFGGTLSNIEVTGNDGIISGVRFVKYSGVTANVVNASDISTGEAFYVDINKNSNVTQITGMKLKTSESAQVNDRVYTAKIWFFKHSQWQYLIYSDVGDSKYNPNDGEGSSNYSINLSMGLSITKVDDRDTNKPLPNVGFTFSATIQTYDEVRSTDKYKACTHVLKQAYTDANGLYHPTTYLHNQDYDWTQRTYEWTDHTMYLDSNNKWTEDSKLANTFYTNAAGQISITDMTYPTKTITNESYKDQSYTSTARIKSGTSVTATEVVNPHYGYSTGGTYSLSLKNNTEIATAKITNHQKYIKLSGYVWLDQHEGKTTVRNDTFDQGESGFNGIKVYLKDTNGNTVKTTTTSELGLYAEIEGGEYQFSEVDIDVLQQGKYYIEYEYNGILYQSVKPNLTENRGSKAIDTYTRNILDSKFGAVNGNGSQTLDMNNVKVEYTDINNYSSVPSKYYGAEVYARTSEAGFDIYKQFVPSMEEIRYINLGLFAKAQTDFALAQDLYDVKVDVNGFAHIYKYRTVRYDNAGNVDEESAWNMGVKFQNNKGTYSRAIYTTDAEYESPNHLDNEIRVYVTYKVTLKNESTYLAKINSIVDYCDNRYSLLAVGTEMSDKDEITGKLTAGEKLAYNDEYSKYIINTNTLLEAGEAKSIYVQFEMDREAILAALNNGELLNNVIEINSYTTFKNNNVNTPVAVIDFDSVPGNTIPGKFETYEDDTDAARSLKLELKNERALEGTVFVDSTGKDSNQIYTNQERLGNGIYDNGEKTLEGIEVTLKEVGKDDSSYDGERVEMKTTTDENGKYEFVGFVPGNYVITYKWGDKEYKVQYYKGTIYDESRKQDDKYWYKGSEYGNDSISSTIRKTDALDDYDTRTIIDDEMEALKYNTLENEINKAYEGESDYIKTTTMTSSTPEMAFSVEYETTVTDGNPEQVRFTVKNVDFGIVERPKQLLQFEKTISKYKIVLANNQVLVDAEIDENGNVKGTYNYTTFIPQSTINEIKVNGILRTEVDDEIIEGSTIEATYRMKVTNIGEIDYTSDRYYFYGNNSESDKVRVSVTELLDYVDGRLSVVDDKWELKDKEYLNKVNARQKDNQSYLNTTKTYMTNDLTKAIAPGESYKVDLLTSKLLSSSDDNTFDNQAEITEITKNEGFNTGTPVKALWTGNKFYYNVDNSETIIIIENTGDDKGYIIPVIVTVTALLVIGVGTFVIKKYVIDNK